MLWWRARTSRTPLTVRPARAVIALAAHLLLFTRAALALNPSLEVSQYGHSGWTARNGFSMGAIFAMAQTPDGFLWLASEFGLFRFDGIKAVPWRPPAGQPLPERPYALLVTRDGTLWIGTFAGLASWNGETLTRYPEVGEQFVTSLLEDREGTIWAGVLGATAEPPSGQLCAIRSGHVQCDRNGGAFGAFVWSLVEDSAGTLWAGAESGVWRWKPGAPRRYEMPGARVGDLTRTADGHVLIGVSGGGLLQVAGDRLVPYPIRDPASRGRLFPDRSVDSNKLLRDRNGNLWIGTNGRGLVHVHDGGTDLFARSDGLAGDIACSLFEDREGNIWVATTGGLDRFRELPVTTISTKQGLSSEKTHSVLAATDGSVWVAAKHGLTRWKNGQARVFDRADGLPHDTTQSLFQDDRGRVWVFTGGGLAYLKDDRFVHVPGVPAKEVFSMAGDGVGGLWLSTGKSLLHMRDGRLVESFPWSVMGRQQQAKVVVPDRDGVWLAFWAGGGLLYFEDGKVRASYTPADGLGAGQVADLRRDREGALWAATQGGGLSRIKDGRVATLTTGNGLPCDMVHWSIEDDDRSLWLYAVCGLVRITRTDLDAWIADPKSTIRPALWDAADGVKLHAFSPGYFNPPVAKSTDGRLWFSGDGVQVVDPRHLAVNGLAPPVLIEQVVADGRTQGPDRPRAAVAGMRLPARTRDLQIEYTALSLVAPEKVRFKFKLEGQDRDWREMVGVRQAQYTNLPPGSYRFRVIACNDSGVWNEEGASLDLAIAPAFYQTGWFLVPCMAACAAMLWAAWQWRLRRLRHQLELALDARVAERTRIARELHDTLLQGTQGMLLIFASAVKLLPERALEAKERLERALDQAAEAMAEARDTVQGLRESVAETGDLAPSLARIAQELSAGEGAGAAVMDVVVDGTPRPLKPLVRDEVYRIAAEALRNAGRHAKARHVTASLLYDARQFRLVVRDDGVGMDEQALRDAHAGHFGVPGMRERAAVVGGRLEVLTRPGLGTVVELSIPGATAYAASRRAPITAASRGPAPPEKERPG